MLSDPECYSIMASVLSVGLPNMGLYCNMVMYLVYVPLNNQWLCIDTLYTTQGLVLRQEMVNHIWRGIGTWKLIRSSIEYASRGSLYKLNYDLCEDMWVKYMWNFCVDLGIKIDNNLVDFDLAKGDNSTLASNFAAALKISVVSKSK